MKITEALRYTNDYGDSLYFSYTSALQPIGFADTMDVNFYTSKNALEDGESVEGKDLEPRSLIVTAEFKVGNQYKELERRIRKTFNPKIGGVLALTDGNDTKEIYVQVDGIPEFKYKRTVGTVVINLIAYGSYWQKAKVTEQLAYLTPGLMFPQYFTGGMIFGKKTSQLVSVIKNIGDADCGSLINLKATGGSIRNPFVRSNKTGQAIKFSVAMEKNDVLTIDYMAAQPVIYRNGVKNFGILDAVESEFFKLLVGDNELEYGAEVNAANLTVSLSYKPLML